MDLLMVEFNELKAASSTQSVVEAYQKLIQTYPSSGAIWSAYAQYLYRMHLVPELEKAFAASLRTILDVRLWRIYLQHVLQANLKNGDMQVIMQAYEFAITTLGVDLQAGSLWQEYIELLRVLPGIEQNVRTEMIRKVYSRALAIPLDNLETLWSQYDVFEQTVNRATAKKMIADRSAAYMTARAHIKSLQELSLEGVDRDALSLPEVHSDDRSDARAAGWLRWILWEQSNPLQLDKTQQSVRVMYAFKKTLMVLRHRPEIWLCMASYCGEVGGEESVITNILKQAIEYNPASLSLALALAERYEVDGKSATEARNVYEQLLSVLEAKCCPEMMGDELNHLTGKMKCLADRLNLAYVQFMAFCRRTEGVPAARAVFTRARKHHLVGPQVYSASAQMEFYARKDASVAVKIFELGMAKYGNWSVEYVLDYIGLLSALNDDTNLRALFERAIVQLGRESGVIKIWERYLEFESKWGGDLSALRTLEKRFVSSFPSTTNEMEMFERRYRFGSLSVQAEAGQALELAKNSHNEDSRVLLAKAGGRSCLTVPGCVPEMLIVLLSRLPTTYDGPVVPPESIMDLLSRYPPARSHSNSNTGASGEKIGGSHYERSGSSGGDRRDDHNQHRRTKRTSTYDQVFDDRKRRSTKK